MKNIQQNLILCVYVLWIECWMYIIIIKFPHQEKRLKKAKVLAINYNFFHKLYILTFVNKNKEEEEEEYLICSSVVILSHFNAKT